MVVSASSVYHLLGQPPNVHLLVVGGHFLELGPVDMFQGDSLAVEVSVVRVLGVTPGEIARIPQGLECIGFHLQRNTDVLSKCRVDRRPLARLCP